MLTLGLRGVGWKGSNFEPDCVAEMGHSRNEVGELNKTLDQTSCFSQCWVKRVST